MSNVILNHYNFQMVKSVGSGRLRIRRATVARPRTGASSLAAPKDTLTVAGMGRSTSEKDDAGATATPFNLA